MKKFINPIQFSEKVNDLQAQRLHHYISRVIYPFSPYYRDVMLERGLKPKHIRTVKDLQKLPFTSKEDLINTPQHPLKSREFVIQPEQRILQRRLETIGSVMIRGKKNTSELLEREYRPIFMTSTTGRSAEPIPFVYTHHDLQNLSLAGANIIKLGGAKKDDKILNMFPYAPHLAYWLTHYACTHMNIFCVSTGGGKVMGTDGNIRMMVKIKPSIIVGMPTFVYHVLKQAKEESQVCDSIRTIVLGGEKVVEGTRRKLSALAEELGSKNVRVIATYGFTEAKMAWAEAPANPGEASSGYHLTPELGIVEVVDPKSGEVLPPETPGEIVFTPLNARGSTVLRYRTGDFISEGLTYSKCPHSGIFVPRLVGKISRTSEFKSMQLKKLKGTIVNFNEIDHILDDVPGIGTWQVELRKQNNDPLEVDELVLHITTDDNISKELLEHRIYENFQEVLEICPNEIQFHSTEEMCKMQEVGKALKEVKFVDNRPSGDEKSETHVLQNPQPQNKDAK